MEAAKLKIHQIGLALSFVTLILLGIFNLMNKSRADRMEAEKILLVRKLEQAGEQLARKTQQENQHADFTVGPTASPIELFSWDIRAMQKKGLKDPVNDIVSDLKQHREIIPFEATMGGTMNFYDRSKIRILTNKWVLAYVEDGHKGGYVLLEYQIAPGGKIIWKILASYLA